MADLPTILDILRNNKPLQVNITASWDSAHLMQQAVDELEQEGLQRLAKAIIAGEEPEEPAPMFDMLVCTVPKNLQVDFPSLADATISSIGDAVLTSVDRNNTPLKFKYGGMLFPHPGQPGHICLLVSGGVLVIGKSGVIPVDDVELVERELLARNSRLRFPIVEQRCPNCGVKFMPTRRGQVFHNRSCATAYGERKRYKSIKNLASK